MPLTRLGRVGKRSAQGDSSSPYGERTKRLTSARRLSGLGLEVGLDLAELFLQRRQLALKHCVYQDSHPFGEVVALFDGIGHRSGEQRKLTDGENACQLPELHD